MCWRFFSLLFFLQFICLTALLEDLPSECIQLISAQERYKPRQVSSSDDTDCLVVISSIRDFAKEYYQSDYDTLLHDAYFEMCFTSKMFFICMRRNLNLLTMVLENLSEWMALYPIEIFNRELLTTQQRKFISHIYEPYNGDLFAIAHDPTIVKAVSEGIIDIDTLTTMVYNEPHKTRPLDRSKIRILTDSGVTRHRLPFLDGYNMHFSKIQRYSDRYYDGNTNVMMRRMSSRHRLPAGPTRLFAIATVIEREEALRALLNSLPSQASSELVFSNESELKRIIETPGMTACDPADKMVYICILKKLAEEAHEVGTNSGTKRSTSSDNYPESTRKTRQHQSNQEIILPSIHELLSGNPSQVYLGSNAHDFNTKHHSTFDNSHQLQGSEWLDDDDFDQVWNDLADTNDEYDQQVSQTLPDNQLQGSEWLDGDGFDQVLNDWVHRNDEYDQQVSQHGLQPGEDDFAGGFDQLDLEMLGPSTPDSF